MERLVGCGRNYDGQVCGHAASQRGLSTDQVSAWKASGRAQKKIELFAGHSSYEVLATKYSYTVIRADIKLFLLGRPNINSPGEITVTDDDGERISVTITSVFGTDFSLKGALDTNGSLYLYDSSPRPTLMRLSPTVQPKEPLTMRHVAMTWTDKVAVVTTSNDADTSENPFQTQIFQFLDFALFKSWFIRGFKSNARRNSSGDAKVSRLLDTPLRITSLTAGASAFAALTDSGQIYTWAETGRAHELGRSVDDGDAESADKPGLVAYLDGVRVVKVAACGATYAALSADRDLYMWGDLGAHNRTAASRLPMEGTFGIRDVFAEVDTVNLLDVDWEVQDFGVGRAHVVVVSGGKVKVIGENGYGQLSLGVEADGVDVFREWTDLEASAAKIVCGPVTTFIITGSS